MGRVPFDHIDCKGEDVEPSAPHGSSPRRIQGHLRANEQDGRPTILSILHHRVVLIGGRGVNRAGSQVPPSPRSRGSFRLLTASGVSAAEDGMFHPYLVPLRSRFLTSIRLRPDPTGGAVLSGDPPCPCPPPRRSVLLCGPRLPLGDPPLANRTCPSPSSIPRVLRTFSKHREGEEARSTVHETRVTSTCPTPTGWERRAGPTGTGCGRVGRGGGETKRKEPPRSFRPPPLPPPTDSRRNQNR